MPTPWMGMWRITTIKVAISAEIVVLWFSGQNHLRASRRAGCPRGLPIYNAGLGRKWSDLLFVLVWALNRFDNFQKLFSQPTRTFQNE